VVGRSDGTGFTLPLSCSGDSVGSSVGVIDGSPVSFAVAVGSAEGTATVGSAVGTLVGLFVLGISVTGFWVGSPVGLGLPYPYAVGPKV
jgi:hypothetical protein